MSNIKSNLTKILSKPVKQVTLDDIKASGQGYHEARRIFQQTVFAKRLIGSADDIKAIDKLFSKEGQFYDQRQIKSDSKYLSDMLTEHGFIYLDKEGKNKLAMDKIQLVSDLPHAIQNLRKINKDLFKPEEEKSTASDSDVPSPEPQAEAEPQSKPDLSAEIIAAYKVLMETDMNEADSVLSTIQAMYQAELDEATKVTAKAA